jgi:subtilisin family serine protease
VKGFTFLVALLVGAVLISTAAARGESMHASAIVPNDPSFGLQWGSENTGQSVPFQESEEALGPAAPGTPGDDDGALAAWQVSTGSRSIVIGETDTGVDYEHPDLAANIWSNPGTVGGCAAGTHGYDVLNKTCDPMDDNTTYDGHGTHVAGIMGAVGGNGIGVAGIDWQTTILPVKWLNAGGWGETSGLIEALQWLVAAKQAGVNIRVVNDSATFVGTAFSQALSNEIDTLGANNILFVTAAGNTGEDDDELADRRYPCGYDRPTEICVTADNDDDQLPSWANYGAKTVDLAAPGVSVYSTLRGGAYGYLSGGSMAAPQVSGAAALILSVEPSLSVTELKADILDNVQAEPALTGKVISGGTLDICKALPGCVAQPPPTFGHTTVGEHTDSGMFSNYKIVNAATLGVAGSVSRLDVYSIPGIDSPSPQALKAVIYADSGGSPGALVATGTEVIYRGNVNGSGWFELPFAKPVALAAGSYWLGFITGASSEGMGYRYDTLANSRAYNANAFSAGPTNPFGTTTKDSELASLYATYTPAAPVQSTFGKTTVGANSDSFAENRKRVSSYALPTAGTVRSLSVYLQPSGHSGQQLIEGVLYGDSGGKPGALIATTSQLTFKSTGAAGWYTLTFPSPPKLAAGEYWLGVITGAGNDVAGFRYDNASGSRLYNANVFTAGPSNPFGAASSDGEQTSLYATYTAG